MTYAIRVIQRSNMGNRSTAHDFGANHEEFGTGNGDRAAVRDALAKVAELESSRTSHVRAIVFAVEPAERLFRESYPHDITGIDRVRGWNGETFDD